tara:strand:- start:36 stop:1064 length:1029 start_codon:yes stop_codon:yes gene_type:complete
MALKTKTPRFKDIGSGEMNTGGAPIFADDILRVQENNRKDYINTMEALRLKLPSLLYGGTQNFKNGLILSGCEYNNTDPLNPVLSPGFILSGGEVCFFPGGTFNTGTSTGLIYLYKGAESPVSRTFNDGTSKEILTSFTCTVETANVSGGALVMPTGTGITSTTEAVVISCGSTSAVKNIGEDFFTQRAALKITDISKRVKIPAFSPVTVATNWQNASNFSGSRVNADLSTTIYGNFQRNYATAAGASTSELVCTLAASGSNLDNATPYGNSITVILQELNNTAFIPTLLNVSNNGDLKLFEPVAGWPTTGFYFFTIQTTIIGSTTAEAFSSEIASNFLETS